MKTYKKGFFILILFVMAFALFIAITNTKNRAVAQIPSGYTVDSTKDEISVSDININGLVNQKVIKENENVIASYKSENENGSLVFRFRYDVVDTTNNDSVALRVHFGYDDGTNDYFWCSYSSLWLRGDGVYLSTYNGSNLSWSKKTALSQGIHDIEFGRIALFENDKLSNKYFLYYKVDGVTIDSIVNTYDLSKIRNSMFFNFSAGNLKNKVYDIDFTKTDYEIYDEISISDLRSSGYPFGETLSLTKAQSLSFNSTSDHKSVVLRFIYEAKDPSNYGCQIHFSDGYMESKDSMYGGMIWLKSDNTYIRKDDQSYVKGNKAFTKAGIYNVEVGKLYIDNGADKGKYYIYIKVDGVLLASYTTSTMPDKANIFTTGDNGDNLYDINYMPFETNSDLYIYKWDAKESGIEFESVIGKEFIDYKKVDEVGFIIHPNDNIKNTTKIKSKLTLIGNKYYVKAAIAGLNDDNITREYTAQLYYVLKDDNGKIKTYYSKEASSSFYKELFDLSNVPKEYLSTLESIKSKILNVSIDEDDCTVTGATKTGDFSKSSITLTGDKNSYSIYVINNEPVENGSLIKIGYYSYLVNASGNSVVLTKQARKMMYGGSEHFVELNSGHDPLMNAKTLSPMAKELNLKTMRLDVSLSDLFSVNSNDELTLNSVYQAKVQGIIDELKSNGGVTDFLAVLWTVQPYGYSTWSGRPWSTNTAPDPITQPEMYLRWLKLNEEAVRRCAELFPDIRNYETWNEPEMMDGDKSPLSRTDGTNYTAKEKARILTDLMYYFNRGIKKANPKNVLTSPSICCAQNTNDSRFDVTSLNFMSLMYQAIKDDTPVPGVTELDKDANNYFQVINVHPYLILGLSTLNFRTFMNNLHNLAVNNDDAGTEIWITEFGFAQNRTKNCQANMLTVMSYSESLEFITKFYFYKVHDYGNTKGNLDDDKWGLYNYDCTIKEIGLAVKKKTNPDAS